MPAVTVGFLIAVLVLAVVHTVYNVTGMLLKPKLVGPLPPGLAARCRTLWKWTKWPSLVNVLLQLPIDAVLFGNLSVRDCLLTAFDAVIWWWLRNAGDDDTMKKLKKTLTAVVERVGDKLAVVPKAA